MVTVVTEIFNNNETKPNHLLTRLGDAVEEHKNFTTTSCTLSLSFSPKAKPKIVLFSHLYVVLVFSLKIISCMYTKILRFQGSIPKEKQL